MSQEDAHVGKGVARPARMTQSAVVDLSAGDYLPPWVPDKLYVGLGAGFGFNGRLLGDSVDRYFYLDPGFHDLAIIAFRQAGASHTAAGINVFVLRGTE